MVGKYLFHLPPTWLVYLVLMSAMPTAQNVFIFSQKYRVGIERSNLLVFITTIISFVTINLILIAFS
jgi:predicted permease